MFSASARRVALNAHASPVVASIKSSAPRTVAKQLSYRSHQRRCSSSKPSNPADNGPKRIADNQPVSGTRSQTDVTAQSSQKNTEEDKASKASGSRKQKGVAASSPVKTKDDTSQNLPSVPSTQHVKSEEIAASSFFSLYRPISVTSSFPRPVTGEAFAAIFTPRTRSNLKTAEVITALSNTISKMEAPTQQSRWNAETDELRAAIHTESQQDTRHLDGSPGQSLIPFPQHILGGRFQPFHPPPPPTPANTPESLAAGAEASEGSHIAQQRIYTATLTIKESTDENGDVTYVATSSPVVVEEPASTPSRFLERMNIRQEKFNEYRERRFGDDTMWSLSVKRQRKLKMKKHKYKKLMKRTRNLRRRLDRA